MPEFLTTFQALIASVCFILGIIVFYFTIQQEDKFYMAWCLPFMVFGSLALMGSQNYLDSEELSGVEFIPLVKIDKADRSKNMTIIPYTIVIEKTTVSKENRKKRYYEYNADLYLQKSEVQKLKSGKSGGFSIAYSKENNKSGCFYVKYGNRMVESIQRGQYYVNCIN